MPCAWAIWWSAASRIANVDVKEGNSGLLCFVTVEHEITRPRGVAVQRTPGHRLSRSAQNAGPRGMAERAHDGPHPTRKTFPHRHGIQEARVDSVALFRYSALTFNSHRIHYDRRYCIEEEGYPGLVVHGPLQATVPAVLRGLDPRPRADKFSYRGVNPMFDDSGCVRECRGRR